MQPDIPQLQVQGHPHCESHFNTAILARLHSFVPPLSQINTADHSGSQWLSCFQETATEVLGTSAEELGRMKDTDESAFDGVFQQANFKEYIFKVRAKMDTFNVSIIIYTLLAVWSLNGFVLCVQDEQRLKCYCVVATPVNYVQETRRRIEEIKTMLA